MKNKIVKQSLLVKKEFFLLRRYFLMPLFCLLLTVLLTACGRKSQDYEISGADLEYYDIQSEQKVIFKGKEDENSAFADMTFVGMQYYQGEPVQLWLSYEEEEKKNLYLCRTDSSRELLLEGLESGSGARWYLDEDGSLYCWKRSFDINIQQETPYIRKLDASGKEIFRKELQPGTLLWDFCRLEDGIILLLFQEDRGESLKLLEMNPRTGSLSEKPGIQLEQSIPSVYIASGNQGVLLLETGYSEGITEVSMEDGSVFSAQSFMGTSYSAKDSAAGMEVRDFRIPEDGMMEILWADPVNGRSIQETLQLSKMNKIPVILKPMVYMEADPESQNVWLKERIADFNRENSKYQVIIEPPADNDKELLAARMATGKGPDILHGYAIDWVYALVEKGGLEDLAPYMKESGMLEEDYFPYAFSCLRDEEKIYTFRSKAPFAPSIVCIRAELLGGREVSDIGELLDALLAWEGDAWLNHVAASVRVLQLFYNSEDFWGMIDWENGTCDFSGDLFIKMLKTAKKYGVSWEKALAKDYESYMDASNFISCTLLGYKTSAELKKLDFFNLTALLDGAWASMSETNAAIAINANSAQKEGAWEFLRYLMSEEVQMTVTDYNERVNKRAHWSGVEQDLEWLNSDSISEPGKKNKVVDTISIYPAGSWEIIKQYDIEYTKEDMTQERIDEYLNTLENVTEHTTLAYVRLLPIYEIIEEEVEYYFSDAKSLEEVVDIINRRIGLYVGERH